MCVRSAQTNCPITPGAGEQRRKKEDVRCPVCRALWPYTVSLTPSTPVAVHVSVPVGEIGDAASEGAMGGGPKAKGASPSHYVLSGQKVHLLERIKYVRYTLHNMCVYS